MTAIATISGRVIDFLAPDPAQIHLDDIARGLARQARYTGQTVRPYSVAMHSLLVAELVPHEHRLHALLHDAPEAYTGDAPSPMKEAMRAFARVRGHASDYDLVEHGLWKAVCRRFDIAPDLPEEVHLADRWAMLVEAPELQPRGWEHAVWDFAREDEKQVPGIHRGLLFRICALPDGAYVEWLLAVADELTRRKGA